MTSRILVKQLGSLKSIKPGQEWHARTRAILIAQISGQGNPAEQKASIFGTTTAYLRGAILTGYRHTFEQLFARPLVFSGALSVFVVMVASAFIAAQSSVPGDPLYTMKRTGEQVQVAFVSPSDRPGLQFDIAKKRIAELATLSLRQLTNEERSKQSALLVKEASDSIATAQKDLRGLIQETPQKAVQAATDIKKRVEESEKQVAQLPEGADMIARLDETKEAALSVIVEKKDAAKVPEKEIVAHLQEAIESLEARHAQLISVQAAGFRDDDGAKKSQKIKETLNEARAGIERGDFTFALSSISASREIIASAEKDVARLPGADADTGDGGLK